MAIYSYPFTFVERQEVTTDGVVFDIDISGLTEDQELFDYVGSVLGGWNGYFGSNWNAFYDVFCDLGWLSEKEVTVYIHQIPFTNNKANELFISTLADVESSWRNECSEQVCRGNGNERDRNYDCRRVEFVFSPKEQILVQNYLKEYVFDQYKNIARECSLRTVDLRSRSVCCVSKDYCRFLDEIGYGEILFTLYSGPASVSSIYGEQTLPGLPVNAQVIADDMAGTCFALDFDSGVIYSITDSREVEEYAEDFLVFLLSELH